MVKKLRGGSIVIDMTNIENTDLPNAKKKSQLVGHLKSADFFDVKNFKEASYTVTKVNKISRQRGLPGTYEFVGDLKIKDKTVSGKKLRVGVKVEKDGSLIADGKMKFDRSKFNVKFNSKTFFPDLVKTAKEKVIGDEDLFKFSCFSCY